MGLTRLPGPGPLVPSADATTNQNSRDVVGNKSDAQTATVGTTASIIAYIKGLLTNYTAARAGYLDNLNGASNLDQVPANPGTAIKSIQRGTIAITSTNQTNTATITSVDTAKSILIHLGQKSGGSDSSQVAYLELTDATTVTASREGTSSTLTVSYEVVEYY